MEAAITTATGEAANPTIATDNVRDSTIREVVLGSYRPTAIVAVRKQARLLALASGTVR